MHRNKTFTKLFILPIWISCEVSEEVFTKCSKRKYSQRKKVTLTSCCQKKISQHMNNKNLKQLLSMGNIISEQLQCFISTIWILGKRKNLLGFFIPNLPKDKKSFWNFFFCSNAWGKCTNEAFSQTQMLFCRNLQNLHVKSIIILPR